MIVDDSSSERKNYYQYESDGEGGKKTSKISFIDYLGNGNALGTLREPLRNIVPMKARGYMYEVFGIMAVESDFSLRAMLKLILLFGKLLVIIGCAVILV
ncbi:hypothetical protein KFK09_012202 [Dendrobium nobile]|uniref:Uncharacterized protein n=1 Tax=Dendrobium nobile TaxID=94219 RepID=A0A8T3BER4_DENNO|nr:hypothetical protein KFK09_012202 [Dendrobium nobile]